MNDELKHPADAPEQEITSEGTDLLKQEAEAEHAGEVLPVGSPAQAPGSEAEPEEEAPTDIERPAPKLERLHKILAQAGVASRRHAEELITQGRVQVNGQIVTVLGSKADPARDHIRVDGKLLHGAERLRYFVLNKPKGYVTTVSDPEGRPTVMGFFAKQGERLYPVGRLDYQSEGLLLVTNDGDLANRLTQAASGVEKTYLVKVAGQPSEAALERLRHGVAIERDKPGGGKVHTAPAQIRPVRAGDNPWYEVVLIEGRNRELRKMFEEIGHHVEKIRRVGYGPLVLDVEPGKMRELDSEEVRALQLTAEGKLKPRRPRTTQMLPKEAGQSTEQRMAKKERARRDFAPRRERRDGFGGKFRTKEGGAGRRGAPSADRRYDARPERKERDFGKSRGERPGSAGRGRENAAGRSREDAGARRLFAPRREAQDRPSGFDRGAAQNKNRGGTRSKRAFPGQEKSFEPRKPFGAGRTGPDGRKGGQSNRRFEGGSRRESGSGSMRDRKPGPGSRQRFEAGPRTQSGAGQTDSGRERTGGEGKRRFEGGQRRQPGSGPTRDRKGGQGSGKRFGSRPGGRPGAGGRGGKRH